MMFPVKTDYCPVKFSHNPAVEFPFIDHWVSVMLTVASGWCIQAPAPGIAVPVKQAVQHLISQR